MDVATNVTEMDWKEGSLVALTPWFEDLSKTHMPHILRDILMRSPVTLWNVTLEEAGQLAQWSDLLIFDYLTGELRASTVVSSYQLCHNK
jgi:four-jointed box protein 1